MISWWLRLLIRLIRYRWSYRRSSEEDAMNHAMYSTDRHTYLQIVVIILLCAVCYQGDASEELIRNRLVNGCN